MYHSIEELAESLNVTTRSVYRQLKEGKIKKKRGRDGGWVYILDEDRDSKLSDDDSTIDVNSDVIDVNGDTEPITGVSTRRDRKFSARPESGLVKSMRDELEVAKVEFEIEKVEDARAKWQERKGREQKERAEAERIHQLGEIQIREQQYREEEREAKKRDIIQKAKKQVIPVGMRAFIPVHILAFMYQEIEKVLSKMDVLSLPFNELVVLTESIKNRVIEQNNEEVRQALYEYFINLSRNGLKECLKQMYNDYREHGGELCYRDFILNNANSPDEREQLLNLIAL